MKKTKLLMILLPFLALAQTATVYDLAESDSAKGRMLYADMEKADSAYKAWEKDIKGKLLSKDLNCYGKTVQACGADIEFTEDFKHAAPKAFVNAVPPWTMARCNGNVCW